MGIGGLIATAFVIGLSGAMAPGSLLVVVVTETVRRGFWAGPVAVLGHAVIEAAMVILLALGLGRVLSYPSVLAAIGLAGGLMLFWFGWATCRTAKSATLSLSSKTAASSASPAAQRSDKGLWSAAVAGMAASVSNPYWILWWATIGAAYVATGMSYGAIGPVTFFIGHISSDMTWYAVVSLAIATGTRFFSDRIYRGVLYVCAAFLFLFGAYFLKAGVAFVMGR